MNSQINNRITLWHSKRYEQVFNQDEYSDQLYNAAFEDLSNSSVVGTKSEALGNLFFICIGGLWKIGVDPSEYENVGNKVFLNSNSGPFKSSYSKEAISWLVLQIMQSDDNVDIKNFTLILLVAILENLAKSCTRDQAEKILAAICKSKEAT